MRCKGSCPEICSGGRTTRRISCWPDPGSGFSSWTDSAPCASGLSIECWQESVCRASFGDSRRRRLLTLWRSNQESHWSGISSYHVSNGKQPHLRVPSIKNELRRFCEFGTSILNTLKRHALQFFVCVKENGILAASIKPEIFAKSTLKIFWRLLLT